MADKLELGMIMTRAGGGRGAITKHLSAINMCTCSKIDLPVVDRALESDLAHRETGSKIHFIKFISK